MSVESSADIEIDIPLVENRSRECSSSFETFPQQTDSMEIRNSIGRNTRRDNN